MTCHAGAACVHWRVHPGVPGVLVERGGLVEGVVERAQLVERGGLVEHSPAIRPAVSRQ